MDIRSLVLITILRLSITSCINEFKIREITERFENSVKQIREKVDCQVSTVKEKNGCLLKAYTDKCIKRPSLKILGQSLFPLSDLEKLTGGFIDENKLSVILYSVNLCNKNNSFFEISLQSLGSYQIAERFITTLKTEFNIKFSVSKVLQTLKDVSIDSGHSLCSVDNKSLNIYFNSPNGDNNIAYNFKTDLLSLKDIVQLFQQHSIDSLFDESIINNSVIPLNNLVFLDVEVIGTSIPSNEFEFQITGKVNGNDIFQNKRNSILVIQKNINELSDVKCLLYSILNNVNYSNLNELFSLNDIIPNIPFFHPLNEKVLLTISNDDIKRITSDKVKDDLSTFIDVSVSRKEIINKGFNVLYLLERLSSKTDKLLGENEEEGSTVKEKASSPSPSSSSSSSSVPNKDLQQVKPDGKSNKETVENFSGILRANIPDTQTQFQYVPPQYQQWNTFNANQQQQFWTNIQQSNPYNNILFPQRMKKDKIEGEVEEGSGETRTSDNQKSNLVSSNAKYFVYKMKLSNTSEIEIEPQQLVISNYEQLVKYSLGKNKATDWESLPLYETLELMLNKIVLKKSNNILQMNFDVTQTVPYVVIDNFIEFKVLAYNIGYTFDKIKTQKQWHLEEGSRKYQLNGETIPKVIFDKKKGKYYLNDTLDVYCENDLIQEYGVSPLQKNYEETFQQLSKFSFKKPRIMVELGEDIHKAKIKAEGLVLDNDNVVAESLLWQHGNGKEIMTSLLIRNMGLDEFLKELYQKKMLKSCWLDMKKIILVYGSSRNESIGDDVLENEEIIDRSYKFTDSLALFGSMKINLKLGCLDDPVCNFIKNHITHDLYAVMKGEITTKSYDFTSIILEGSSSFGNIWGISNIVLNVKGNNEKDSGTSIEGFITHKATRNTGRFFVGEDLEKGNIVLKILLNQPWNDVLDFKSVRLTNINSNMDVSGDEKIKKIELKSTLEIGSTNRPLKLSNAKMIIDMKKSSSDDNVIFARLKNINVTDLRDAFNGLEKNQLIQKMSFIDDMKICFTRKEKGYQVEEFGMYVFNPTCNAVAKMSTFAGNVTVQFDFSQMLVHFQSQKLSYQNDRLVLTRRKNSDAGPNFVANLENHDKNGKWKMKGYIQTIGYEGNIHQDLFSSQIDFKFSTFLFNEIKGNGSVTGEIDSDMSNAMYTFQLDNKMTNKEISKHFRKHISMEATLIQKDIISHCEKLIKNVSDLISDMKEQQNGMTSLSESKKSDVFRKKSEIDMANEHIKKDCISSCGKKCVTALDWDHDCSNVRGQKFGCLKWKECQSEAADTNCIAICEAKKYSHSQNAYVQRDKIRYLVEDISDIRDKITSYKPSLNAAETLLMKVEAQIDNVNTKFSFIMDIDTEADHLISLENSLISRQKLSNVKPPCLKFDNISFNYRPYSTKYIYKQTFCAGGTFYKDMAHAIMKGIDKKFEEIAEMKSDTMVEIIALETSFKEMLKSYREETEKDSEDPAYSDIFNAMTRTIHKQPTATPHQQQNNFALFNDTAIGEREEKISKRDIVGNNEVRNQHLENDDESAMLEATEMEIADFVMKDSRTFKIFENEAPWVYMNKKRGVTIPPLGMLHFKGSSKNSSCHRRRDTIEHFEDLLGSLEDAKKFYDQGEKTMDKMKLDLQTQKNQISEEIKNAKENIRSRTLQKDVVFWLEKCNDGINEYIASANRQLEHQNKVGLKYWSTQLNSAVRSNIANKVSTYFYKLKNNVISTFKKSSKRSKIEGKDALDTMTKEFINIAEKEPLLSELKNRLDRIAKKINQFKHSAIANCKT